MCRSRRAYPGICLCLVLELRLNGTHFDVHTRRNTPTDLSARRSAANVIDVVDYFLPVADSVMFDRSREGMPVQRHDGKGVDGSAVTYGRKCDEGHRQQGDDTPSFPQHDLHPAQKKL